MAGNSFVGYRNRLHPNGVLAQTRILYHRFSFCCGTTLFRRNATWYKFSVLDFFFSSHPFARNSNLLLCLHSLFNPLSFLPLSASSFIMRRSTSDNGSSSSQGRYRSLFKSPSNGHASGIYQPSSDAVPLSVPVPPSTREHDHPTRMVSGVRLLTSKPWVP